MKQDVKLLALICLTLNLVNYVQLNSIPVNKLVKEALRRQQREAIADAEAESATETDVSPAGEAKSTSKSNATKIDWDEIERTWYEFKEDEEITKKWNDLEAGLKKGN